MADPGTAHVQHCSVLRAAGGQHLHRADDARSHNDAPFGTPTLTRMPLCMLCMDRRAPLTSARYALPRQADHTHLFVVLGESFYCAVIDVCHKPGLAAAADMGVSDRQARQAVCHAVADLSDCTGEPHSTYRKLCRCQNHSAESLQALQPGSALNGTGLPSGCVQDSCKQCCLTPASTAAEGTARRSHPEGILQATVGLEGSEMQHSLSVAQLPCPAYTLAKPSAHLLNARRLCGGRAC